MKNCMNVLFTDEQGKKLMFSVVNWSKYFLVFTLLVNAFSASKLWLRIVVCYTLSSLFQRICTVTCRYFPFALLLLIYCNHSFHVNEVDKSAIFQIIIYLFSE